MFVRRVIAKVFPNIAKLQSTKIMMHILCIDLLFKPVNKYDDNSESLRILFKTCVKSKVIQITFSVKSFRHFCLSKKVSESFLITFSKV